MQLKKILAIFLAVALVFSALTISVGAQSVKTFEVGVEAETTAPVSSSPKIFNSGDDVSVKISVRQNTGVSFLRFVVYFDSEALELINCTSENLFNTTAESVSVKAGYIIYFLNLGDGVSEATGDLLNINFKANSDYCGNAVIYTELVQGREQNCAVYYSTATNEYVPFVAGSDSISIHSIDVSGGVVTDPTCTENGYTTYICSACSEEVVGNITEKLGHISGAEVEENHFNPTCTEKGSYDMVVYCERCGSELSRIGYSIDELGHDYVGMVTDPTCTEQGYTTYTCTRCGDTYVDDYTSATGHTVGVWVTDAEKHWHICAECGDILDLEPHIVSDWITDIEPTTKIDGQRHKECTVCGEILETEIIPKLYIPGDITGDDLVNNKDLTRLFQYLSGWDVSVNEAALDVNGDGKVSNKDLTRLFQYLSNWDVEIN